MLGFILYSEHLLDFFVHPLNAWIIWVSIKSVGIFSKRVPRGHAHQKPHASLEEAQRGYIHIYAIYSPQNGDFFIHVGVECSSSRDAF